MILFILHTHTHILLDFLCADFAALNLLRSRTSVYHITFTWQKLVPKTHSDSYFKHHLLTLTTMNTVKTKT